MGLPNFRNVNGRHKHHLHNQSQRKRRRFWQLKMRIAALCCFILWLDLCFSAPSFMFVTSIPKSSTYGTLREIRIVAQNYSSWEYKACVADAYHGIGKVYSLNINSNYSYELLPETAPNNGTMNYALTSIQGLTECGYAALVNTSLYNVIDGDTSVADLAASTNWQPPFYAVWINNQVETFLFTGQGVVSRLNTTTLGAYNYSVFSDGMELIKSWELYQEPITKTSYIAYSMSLIDNSAWKAVVDKCNPDCTRDTTLGDSLGFPTITANSTHWFSCYKSLFIYQNVLTSGTHHCTVAGLTDSRMLQIDADYPIESSNAEDPMYSCVMDDTTMMLLVFDSNSFKYTVYALDSTADFSIQSAINGSGYATSMSCADQVILVATWDGIFYYVWDNGTGVVFPYPFVPASNSPVAEPTSAGEPNSTPADVPVFIDTPLVTPTSAVNSNNTGELTANDKVLVGVLVGVGVPVIAGAIVLIVFRNKLIMKKKQAKEKEGSVYTAINSLHKIIPFNELKFTKEIGAGSYGKVFLGTWERKKVAIKMNNQVADTESFMAEARLTLSVPLHPNLVQTYGISMDANTPYIVLEYCEGGSLDQIVFNQTIGHKEQRALVLGIAQGLLHLHANKIVHRDLAARNILLKDGIPKISDFGMSRVLKDESAQGKTKNTVGPIRWMAPESIDDMTYSPKSDVWTFGIVVSEIVLGHEPHHDKNQLDIAVKIRDQGFAPTIPDDSDPVLKELMHMCWKFNPDDRPTMQQIIEFLSDNTYSEV